MAKVLQAFILLLLLVAIGAAGFAAWVWSDLHKKTVHQSASTNFDVSRGERLDQILQDLHERGAMQQVHLVRTVGFCLFRFLGVFVSLTYVPAIM